MGYLIPASQGALKITTNIPGDGVYDIPAGMIIDLIELQPVADLVACEITIYPGGDVIMPPSPVSATDPNLIGTLLKGPVTLAFTGITAETQVTFYRKN